jgi:hypothetical protein
MMNRKSTLGLHPTRGIPPALRDDLQRYYEEHLGGTSKHQVVYAECFFGPGSSLTRQPRFTFNDGTGYVLFDDRHLHAWLVKEGWFFHPAKVPLSIRRDMEADAQVRRLDGLPPTPQPADHRLKFPVKIEGTTP